MRTSHERCDELSNDFFRLPFDKGGRTDDAPKLAEIVVRGSDRARPSQRAVVTRMVRFPMEVAVCDEFRCGRTDI